MWIQKVHTLGLLSSSFLLSDYLQSLRTYYSHSVSPPPFSRMVESVELSFITVTDNPFLIACYLYNALKNRL
jgi:hypothetical protein